MEKARYFFILGASLLFIPQPIFAADSAEIQRCNDIRSQFKQKGLSIDAVLEASNIFDTSQNLRLNLSIILHPSMKRSPADNGTVLEEGCFQFIENDTLIYKTAFNLGRSVFLEKDGRHLAGAWRGPVMVETSTTRGNTPMTPTLRITGGTEVEIYHAVGSSLMKDFGFDTWETYSPANFSPLFNLHSTGFPAFRSNDEVLGVAAKGPHLYQVVMKQYSFQIAN